MDGLIVVHTEVSPYVLKEYGVAIGGLFTQLYDNIAEEVGQQFQLGNRVYYLGSESKSLESELIYPAIRAHHPNMTFIQMNHSYEFPFEAQFLALKEQIIEDGIETSQVCGVLSDICVYGVNQLLSSEGGSFFPKRNYKKVSKEMGWTTYKFEKVFKKKLNAEMRLELTDFLLAMEKESIG